MRNLVTGPDGRDLFVSAPGSSLEVRAGGLVGVPDGADLLGVPFGLVELVVWSGRGAGAVHRLEVGRFRCGPAGDADVPLPCEGTVVVEVRCGGVVTLDGRSWPVGERRSIAGLDLMLRWCAPPVTTPRPVRGLRAADVLLDAIARGTAAPTLPTWEIGRDAAGDPVDVPVGADPVLTIVGAERHALARSVLGRMIAGCDADRLRVTVLAPGADAERRAAWSWVRWLPHARTGDERMVRVGFDDDACARLVAEIAPGRGERLDLVVVDGGVGEPLPVERPGLAVLLLDDGTLEQHPVGVVVEASAERGRVRGAGGAPVEVEVDLPGTDWADRLARALSRVEPDRRSPRRLADLMETDPGDVAAHAEQWSRPATTRVPIGWTREGGELRPVEIDLRADGPHALVGGTTGSGKSELLLTLVAALASANPPEAMSFLLVDYKGGAAFGDCARLPHTVGVVTDLDAGLTARALASLSAEVRRRERLLAAVGATDLEAYLEAGRGPLARLVIVVDEFATLAAELPEFVDGLVDIARRGRSLGLHLVLATQRPAGAVSADIRANTTLRLCLRVAEPADSVDVVGVADAVDIPESEPGRALLRVGQNTPVAVQTARVTTCSDADVSGVPYVVGDVLPEAAARSDLDRLADALTTLAAQRGVPVPQRPWLPPLPGELDLDGLTGVAGEIFEQQGAALPFGVEDRPEEQRRAVADLQLDAGTPLAVVGGARSGRTQTLVTLATSAAQCFDPVDLHVYAIDAGARGLGSLVDEPHVGAVVFRDEPDRLERLVTRLGEEMERRVRDLARHRWSDAADQRRENPADPWPFVLVLVDRWDLLADAAEAVDDRSSVASLERLAAEGGRAGIVVVATGDRGMLTGRMASVFPDRLVLRLSDVYDYAALGVPGPAGHGEPGRGWRGPECVETQVAGAEEVADAGGPDPVPQWAVRGRCGAGPVSAAPPRVPPAAGGPIRIDAVPGHVTRAEAETLPGMATMPRGGLLVAVGGDEVGPRWIDVDEYGPCALVTGRRRSGRSGVLVALAESALCSEEPWEVVTVVGRRSPLAEVQGPDVHGPFRDDEDAARLRDVVDRVVGAGRRLLVLVDDIDLLPEGDLVDELGRLPARLRDTGSFFVGAGEAEEVVAAYRGPSVALRRARCGVMLSPQGSEDGDAFGVRLRRSQFGRATGAGAGYLVLDGLAERVQVVRSGLLPD